MCSIPCHYMRQPSGPNGLDYSRAPQTRSLSSSVISPFIQSPFSSDETTISGIQEIYLDDNIPKLPISSSPPLALTTAFFPMPSSDSSSSCSLIAAAFAAATFLVVVFFLMGVVCAFLVTLAGLGLLGVAGPAAPLPPTAVVWMLRL
jgi:hypothetical protein